MFCQQYWDERDGQQVTSFRDLLAAVKTEIIEISPEQADRKRRTGAFFVDVREPDETDQGIVPESILVVRGNLEAQIENKLPDKSEPVVVLCAGGTRSAFAAKTMQELGYAEVYSMVGGFARWKEEGRRWTHGNGLSASQRNRYSRHLMLPEIDEAGQLRLLESKVLVLGAGGLGSPAALYLAAAGIGTLGIMDMDVVDESNLQRQVLHTTDRVGKPKVQSAKQTLSALNPEVDILAIDAKLSADNIIETIEDFDVIVDGVDNFSTRYLVNDASVKLGIPVVHGSIFRFEGQVSVFDPLRGPTYRDLVPSPPPAELAPNCAEAGVLGVLPGIIGSLQALEAIKLLVGLGESLIGRLLTFDALELEFHEFRLERDPKNTVTFDNRQAIELIGDSH